MGGTQQLARLAGGLAGLGLAFAAAAPFSGVPPQGVSGKPAPAQVEVRALASPELEVNPVGTVLASAEFPPPGERGGPAVKLTLVNQTPVPQRISMRMAPIASALDDAVLVRASGAGAVLLDGPLKGTGAWSLPAGVLSSGESTTLRVRFKLKKGLSGDAYRGRIDIRQLEFKGVPIQTPAEEEESESPAATTPAGAGSPGGNASAAVLPATTPGSTTP
ncbi:MAG: hypothetical protein Q7T55_21765 [Solirubrobacteraceae bacterium]|nr:hypothetical protein [Solirubrobacteraceae bacterium]